MAQSAFVTPVSGPQVAVGITHFLYAQANNTGHTNLTILKGAATEVLVVTETPTQINDLFNA